MRIVPSFIRCCAVLLSVWVVNAAVAAARPNLILIIADDLAWDDCGAYGHKKIRTPNLDAMAREGMRFDRAFLTCSSCSPSRSSMITGRYPHATGAEQLHWPLPAEQVTFVERLRAAGYWTAAAGKWHLGDAVKNRFDLVREANPAGFQLATGAGAGKSKMTAAGHSDVQSGCDEWVPTLQARPKDKPFFLWLAALDPHRDYEENILPKPHNPADVTLPPFIPDHPDVRKDFALYYDEITRLDAFVGKVFAELKAQGIDDNTMVLFTSDNGRAFPRCKTTVYDSGIRTPLFARWPGQIKKGSVCRQLVSSVDYAGTFLELAGVNAPATLQGRSFAPLLKNPSAHSRDYVFAEHNWHDFEAHSRAVRSERFKYIRNAYPELPNTPPADAVRSLTYLAMRKLRDAGTLTRDQMACFQSPLAAEELYDLQTDPHELHNLVANPRHAKTLATLRAELERWQNETGDAVPKVRTPDEFHRETGDPLPNRVRPRVVKPELQSLR